MSIPHNNNIMYKYRESRRQEMAARLIIVQLLQTWDLSVQDLVVTRTATERQTLSLGRRSWGAQSWVKRSEQARRMRSGVAGLSSTNHPSRPESWRAARMASLMANRAAEARKNGGSPTAFDECTAFLFGTSCSHRTISHQISFFLCTSPVHSFIHIFIHLSVSLSLVQKKDCGAYGAWYGLSWVLWIEWVCNRTPSVESPGSRPECRCMWGFCRSPVLWWTNDQVSTTSDRHRPTSVPPTPPILTPERILLRPAQFRHREQLRTLGQKASFILTAFSTLSVCLQLTPIRSRRFFLASNDEHFEARSKAAH